MQKLYLSLLVASLLLVTGCTKDDDSGTTNEGGNKTKVTSYFVDSAVEGITVNCGTQNHEQTDKEGAFSHFGDEKCQFKLGENELGSITLKSTTTVTPLAINQNDYVNIMRMLQTMDVDGNLDNGIQLPKDIKGQITFGNNFEADAQAFLASNSINHPLVSADNAKKHFAVTQTKLALTNKHVSFGPNTGDTYFYADGTLSHDTSNGDTNIPGTWFINSDADLSMNIGNGNTPRIVHFKETPPKKGTEITSGSDTGTLTIFEGIPKNKGVLSIENGFREAYCSGKTLYVTYDGYQDVETFPIIEKSEFIDDNVNPSKTREGYSEAANNREEMFVFNSDGTLDQYIPDQGKYSDSYNRYTITAVNNDGSFDLQIEVPEKLTGKLYLTNPTK